MNLDKIPDPALHQLISFAKSGIRIIAGIVLYVGNFQIAAVAIILAEVLGIIEEIV